MRSTPRSFEEAKLYKESREDPSFFLWDIQLQSSDGTLVPANRFILVRESAVFHRLLSSDFLDSSSKILRVDVSTSILQRLVSALHSDELEFDLESAAALLEAADKLLLLPLLRSCESACQQQVDLETVEFFVSMAHSLHLENLLETAEHYLCQEIWKSDIECVQLWKSWISSIPTA
ncbi:hypothetical protein WJX84_004188 [Apatococcus fuscideae]|uniref:BTB domain-containing protein n=1 Tax=Apatococcus fuscideae TaxID=2026836 RepID=A0AAW1T7L9_9CHLO